MQTSAAEPRPSATVVLLRDGSGGLELLLVQRSEKLSFHGGAWAFPGGSVDEKDLESAAPESIEAGRRAAIRELVEEVGLTLEPTELVPFARWTTPEGRSRRFRTWFFAARAPSGSVSADGGEISDSRFYAPALALSARERGELVLPAPTFVTVVELLRYRSVIAALEAFAGRPVQPFTPRPKPVKNGICSLYEGDAGWEASDPDRPGARHRLWMLESGWRYERDD
jgi:8-oxo-dGTP pyrophosphatase MutT (NUDIX family)